MHPTADLPDRILRRRDAARMLGVSERTLDRMTDVPKLKLSTSRVGYRQSALLAWLEARPLVAA